MGIRFRVGYLLSIIAAQLVDLAAQPNQTVDAYAQYAFDIKTRFITEAARQTPPTANSFEHAWDVLFIALFERGLPPQIAVEVTKEDPSTSFHTSRTRAKKHEANQLKGFAAAPLTTSASTTLAQSHSVPQLAATVRSLKRQMAELRAERDGTGTTSRTYAAAAAAPAAQQAPAAKPAAAAPTTTSAATNNNGYQTVSRGKQKPAGGGSTTQRVKRTADGQSKASAQRNPVPEGTCTYGPCKSVSQDHYHAYCRTRRDDEARGVFQKP